MEFRETNFNSDECQALLDILNRIITTVGFDINNILKTEEEEGVYKKLKKAGEFYMPEMEQRYFLSHSDRHDLFEHIKKVHPTKDMSDNSVQDLLNAIEEKYSDIHKKLWERIITISFIGGTDSEKLTMMKDILQNLKASGFMIVEVNEKGHYIRYFKIDEPKP